MEGYILEEILFIVILWDSEKDKAHLSPLFPWRFYPAFFYEGFYEAFFYEGFMKDI